jgi:hypothetical protein
MNLRAIPWRWTRGRFGWNASTVMLVSAALAACSATKPSPGTPCLVNTECRQPLVCSLGKCHEECKAARDCPNGQRCASGSAGDSTASGSPSLPLGVCLLTKEETCALDSACPVPLVCGKDLKCRNQCETDRDCLVARTQCVPGGMSGVKICAEPEFISNGSLIPAGAGAGPGDGGLPHSDASHPDSEPTDGAVTDASAHGPEDSAALDNSVADLATPTRRVLGFQPSNVSLPDSFTVDGGAEPPAAFCSIGACLLNGWMPVTMSDGSIADLNVVKSLYVDPTYTLLIGGNRPAIIVALEVVDIQGPIVVAPGSSGGFSSATAPGPGGGGTSASGAGGGSYCGMGGPSGLALGGASYGTPQLEPLIGGSAGGGSGRGGGGGALQIIAGKSIIVRALGSISVGGGGGSGRINIAAGGSGGALLLEAPTVTILGKVAANGGGGGGATASGAPGEANDAPTPGGAGAAEGSHGGGGNGSGSIAINGGPGQPADPSASISPGMGGGGAGRIRINSMSGVATVSGVISPAFTTPCATQGVLH